MREVRHFIKYIIHDHTQVWKCACGAQIELNWIKIKHKLNIMPSNKITCVELNNLYYYMYPIKL